MSAVEVGGLAEVASGPDSAMVLCALDNCTRNMRECYPIRCLIREQQELQGEMVREAGVCGCSIGRKAWVSANVSELAELFGPWLEKVEIGVTSAHLEQLCSDCLSQGPDKCTFASSLS